MRIILYHGTASAFDAFDGNFEARGVEPNSALGVHLTESAPVAADYATMATADRGAGEPTVLVVEAEIRRACVCASREDFFGYCAEEFADALFLLGREAAAAIRREARPRFAEARRKLLAEGCDAVAVDDIGDDLAGVWVVLDPARLRIVGRLSPEEAYEAEDLPDLSGIAFDGHFSLTGEGGFGPVPETPGGSGARRAK